MQTSILLILGLVKYGSTILCYECNSATTSMCSAAVLPDTLKRNCSHHDRGVTHTLCRKIIQNIDHEINGQKPASRVIRSCGWDETKYKGACYHRSGYGGHQEVCSCMKDFCNGSDASYAYCYLVLVMWAILTQLYKPIFFCS